jgi:hypothetical protein
VLTIKEILNLRFQINNHLLDQRGVNKFSKVDRKAVYQVSLEWVFAALIEKDLKHKKLSRKFRAGGD